MTPRLCRLALGIAASLAAAASIAGPASAQPFPPGPPDQRRDVAGWLVEFGGESDGGLLVRMTRSHGDYRLEYYVAFWRGNAGPYSGTSIAGAEGPCGGESWQRGDGGDIWRAESDVSAVARDVRGRLAAALAGCGAGQPEISAALAGFDRAFPLAAEWTEVGRLATLAEIEAIENYGSESGAEANPSEVQ